MNNKRRLQIEKMADDVRDKCNVAECGILNIFEVAERLGYKVIRYPIGSNAFLGFSLLKDADRIIFSNSSIILSREIFTVAHEIGHQKLHLSEQGITLIKDNDLEDRDEFEMEANYFAANLLMPEEKVRKFIKFELAKEDNSEWTGWDIAKLQTNFNVSYDMTLYRLKSLGMLNDCLFNKLQSEKIEKSATRLLKAIRGNIDLCKPMEIVKVPDEFLEWAITNYKNKLVPIKSVEKALKYVNLDIEDLDFGEEEQGHTNEESLDDLIGRMD